MFKIMVNWNPSTAQLPLTEYNGWEEVDEADTAEEASQAALVDAGEGQPSNAAPMCTNKRFDIR